LCIEASPKNAGRSFFSGKLPRQLGAGGEFFLLFEYFLQKSVDTIEQMSYNADTIASRKRCFL
jgi:hypothetical protein